MQFGEKTCNGKDPKSANRILTSISAGHGLGEQAMQSLFTHTHTKV